MLCPPGSREVGVKCCQRLGYRVKAMGDMTGLVNHMKEAMRQKVNANLWKEVKHFMPPLLSVKLSDQRPLGAATV